MKLIDRENRTYIPQTGKLGVWIPKMEPSATAGTSYQPHDRWTWTEAQLYILPSRKVVYVIAHYSAIQGQSDSQWVTVFPDQGAALSAAGDENFPHLHELLEESGTINTMPTLE